MAPAAKKQQGKSERLAVALVLDRPVNAANEDKLARLVARLADAGIAHLTLIGEGQVHPANWHLGLASVRRAEIGPSQSTEYFSSERFGLTVLPAGSGRSVVAAAARLLAGTGTRSISIDQFDASVAAVSGPAPDLVIVTGGTPNLRGSLTWSAGYGEFIFFEQAWTELASADLDRALREFAARGRRFGGIE